MKEIILNVEGMVCSGCQRRIQNALEMIDGVEEVIASYENKTVKIIVNQEIAEDVLKGKIEDIGFEVK